MRCPGSLLLVLSLFFQTVIPGDVKVENHRSRLLWATLVNQFKVTGLSSEALRDMAVDGFKGLELEGVELKAGENVGDRYYQKQVEGGGEGQHGRAGLGTREALGTSMLKVSEGAVETVYADLGLNVLDDDGPVSPIQT